MKKDADTEALSYSVEGKIKYAKERARKHRIEKGAYKGSKSRYLFTSGFGEGKRWACDGCGTEAGRLKGVPGKMFCDICR